MPISSNTMITHMAFKILFTQLLGEFTSEIDFNPIEELMHKKAEVLPVNYFEFYNSVAAVYSSKIEGEDIDYDSYFKYKFLNVKYQPDYTKRADDLLKAYEFIYDNKLNVQNVKKALELLSNNLLPKSQRGRIRNNPMFVYY